jgi:hypothetical protein
VGEAHLLTNTIFFEGGGKRGNSSIRKKLGKKSYPKNGLTLGKTPFCKKGVRENTEKRPYRCFGKSPGVSKKPVKTAIFAMPPTRFIRLNGKKSKKIIL